MLKAVAKDRIPNKFRIQIKPVVAESNCPIFQKKWADCICAAERMLIKVLTDHLKNKIELANSQIREATKKTYFTLRTAGKFSVDETGRALANALNEAEKQRKTKREQRQKRKIEIQQQQKDKGKRPKKDSQ